MGYDCYIRHLNKDADPRPKYPFQGGDRAEYDAWETRNYFRRNIFGGSRLADALIEMGMGFDAEVFVPVPEWPKMADYDVEFDEWEDAEGEWQSAYKGERAGEYEAEVNRVLDWHGPEIPGIPVHKVRSSNDGWHVTREECRAAVQLYEFAIRDGKPHPEAFYEDFIPFLKAAAKANGFEVH